MRDRSVDVRQVVGLALVALALLIGGANVQGPLQSLIVEVAAALALGWLLVIKPIDFTDRGLRAPLLWLLAFFAVVAIQLIPLPPGLWRMIPGKQLEGMTADLIGMNDAWRPIALAPEKAVLSAIAMVPCATIFLLLYRGEAKIQAWLGWLVVGFAVLNAGLGLIQTYGENDAAYLYETTHHGSAVGLFANRNHFALLEVIGLVWLASSVRGLREQGLTVLIGAALAAALMVLAIVASNSRSGVVIAALTVSILPFFLVPDRLRRPFAILWCVGAAGAVALLFIGAGLSPDSTIGRLMARFSSDSIDEDGRWTFWSNTLYVARQSFPFGSGLGSFVSAYQANEPLSNVTQRIVNHAHNEYLELSLELGLAGVLLILSAFAWLGMRAWRGIRALGWALTPFHAALLTVVFVAAGSITDYPARTYSIAAVLAASFACIASLIWLPDNDLRRSAK